MKTADYVIVAVILIWFCAAVRIIIKNRGGCGCGAGAGRNCSGCSANGKGCSGCSACKEDSKKGKFVKYDRGKEESKTEGCPCCGMTGRNERREIDSGSGAKEE